jgi:UDP-GlcNAc:undecaprenyl-phosphate GlcNAc-1-phosphate transferase
MENFVLYLIALLIAGISSILSLRLFNRTLVPYFLDRPFGLKKHEHAVPVLGGLAIFTGTLISLTCIRFITNFPTGTLHNLRGIFIGGTLIFAIGLLDDIHKPKGVPVWIKLAVQTIAATALIYYDITIHAIPSVWISYPLTFFWLLGLTNAFNLLDISDGLCVSQAVICTLGITIISLPSEFVYVNFAAVALLGACLGFWPHNHVKNKIFLGDSGATFLGFMLAALSMGTGYCQHVSFGCLAPLFILAIPLFDTFFVIIARIKKGKNPLKGSDDHLALRLKRRGFTNKTVLFSFGLGALLFNLLAYFLTRCSSCTAILFFCFSFLFFSGVTIFFLRQDNP